MCNAQCLRWATTPNQKNEHMTAWNRLKLIMLAARGSHPPKGTSSRRFHEQSTTAMPLAAMSSLSWHETHALPTGLRIMPGKGTPSRSSSTTCSLAAQILCHNSCL